MVTAAEAGTGMQARFCYDGEVDTQLPLLRCWSSSACFPKAPLLLGGSEPAVATNGADEVELARSGQRVTVLVFRPNSFPTSDDGTACEIVERVVLIRHGAAPFGCDEEGCGGRTYSLRPMRQGGRSPYRRLSVTANLSLHTRRATSSTGRVSDRPYGWGSRDGTGVIGACRFRKAEPASVYDRFLEVGRGVGAEWD